MVKMCRTCNHSAKTFEQHPCAECEKFSMWEAKDENPYWERICKLSERQRAKGMETYGQGLEDNPADMLKRIEHLQEELIDGLMYCEWIKDKLMELERGKE